jgi:hypothetical protein
MSVNLTEAERQEVLREEDDRRAVEWLRSEAERKERRCVEYEACIALRRPSSLPAPRRSRSRPPSAKPC